MNVGRREKKKLWLGVCGRRRRMRFSEELAHVYNSKENKPHTLLLSLPYIWVYLQS